MIQRRTDQADTDSVRLRINVAAERLAERKRIVRRRSAALSHRFCSRLASPDMCLLAAGAGFMLAQYSDRGGFMQAVEETLPPRSSSESNNNFFLKVALDLIVRAFASAKPVPEPSASASYTEPGPV